MPLKKMRGQSKVASSKFRGCQMLNAQYFESLVSCHLEVL